MNTTQKYQTLDDEYGLEAVRDAMAVTAGEPDDDVILPSQRLERVMARLRQDNDALRESLVDVNAALAHPGEHGDILGRLKVRLERALQ